MSATSTNAALLDLYPALGRLVELPAFVAALSEDFWLSSIRPWMCVADLTQNETALWGQLVNSIPEVEKFDVPSPGEGASEAKAYRQLVRRAAVRTIAVACGLGTPTFVAHPLLGGDTSIKITPVQGLTCRIGLTTTVSWKPTPTILNRAIVALSNGQTLATVERALFSIMGDEANFDHQFGRWHMLAPLRFWEASHRMPLVGRRCLVPDVPACYHLRYDPSSALKIGVPAEVASKITSPYAADVVSELHTKAGDRIPDAPELLAWALNRCE